jgi:uncharacterized delta-60 repeat protein
MQVFVSAGRRRRGPGRLAALVVAGLLASSASGAPGDPDTSFGFQGQLLVDLGPGSHQARAVGQLPDGRIVVAGDAQGAVLQDYCAVAVLLPDGTLDPGFGDQGRVLLDFDPGQINLCNDLLVQPDGRIVLAGYRRFGPLGNEGFMVIRLNSDGSLDNSFSGDGYQNINFQLMLGARAQANAVALQPDGKLVVAGFSRIAASEHDLAVARLNSNGTLDNSFSGDGLATLGIAAASPSTDQAWSVAIQHDGRIVLAGESRVDYEASMLVARLTSAGQTDSSFNLTGYRLIKFGLVPQASVRKGLVLRPDGGLLLGGYVFDGPGFNADFAVAALLANGQNDPGFGVNGQVIIDLPNGPGSLNAAMDMAVDQAGRMLLGGIGGPTANTDFAAVRLLPTGSPDPSFGTQGAATIAFDLGPPPHNVDVANAIHLLPDGGILLVGGSAYSASGSDFSLVKLQGDPGSDPLFVDGFELPP